MRVQRTLYDREFSRVREDILRLGGQVDRAIERALESLRQRDRLLAKQVIDEDAGINELRFHVEEACLALIATQQPAAGDLRAVVAAMNIVVDIERMADHAAGIAKTVIRMGDEPLLKPLIDIPKMAQAAREMLADSLKAFVARDAALAKKTAGRDTEIDNLYKAVFDELIEIMARDPTTVERGTYLLWCAHNLERIGDRVTNIAERVVFMTTGDMRELNP
jgi:phosphate transport system protein